MRFFLSNIPIILSTLLLFSLSTASVTQGNEKPHHTKRGFKNLYLKENHSFFHFLKWRWERLWKKSPHRGSYPFSLAENNPSFLKSNRNKNTLTWIGHATVFLQMGGKNILTDPHFSERASPIQWAGPKRVVPPGIALNDLPQIDYVIISHDHYDSLDVPTLKKLYAREDGKETTFFVPLGLKDWFEKLGIKNVIELDWWEEYKASEIRIIATPMQHWGKRSPFSRNEHLWASWVVISEGFRFYFGGDTGYSQHFKDIGKRYGPFDLSAMPIGAYAPRWFMKNHHINPEEALQAHFDIKAKQSVGIHWGTFILTDEPLNEPPEKLHKALNDRGLPPDTFLVLKHGETIILR
jgi:L-ascorbate metabolism protein UlaG (beta-lactamase superfamily)